MELLYANFAPVKITFHSQMLIHLLSKQILNTNLPLQSDSHSLDDIENPKDIQAYP